MATGDQRFQLTTNGFQPATTQRPTVYGDRVDFAQLIKVYAPPREGEPRYSPGEIIDDVRQPVMGNPLPEKICTSHVERQKGSMRQWIKRLTL